MVRYLYPESQTLKDTIYIQRTESQTLKDTIYIQRNTHMQ